MNICFMCDLHLAEKKDTCQYKALRWAINDIKLKRPDCICYVGDVTCDGSKAVYLDFVKTMSELDIPFLYIPGNSDLRCKSSADLLKKCSSPTKNRIGDITVFALNDCEGEVSDEALSEIESATDASIVFMHHPFVSLKEPSQQKMLDWQKRHPDTAVFFAHKHKATRVGSYIGLQALDPDKAIGENPSITYYDTDTRVTKKAYFYSGVPADFYRYTGLSCYKLKRDMELAIKRGLRCVELRKDCIDEDRAELLSLVKRWREAGGENLSIHLPDIVYDGERVIPNPRLSEYMSLAELLSADRFTQHVPKVSVKAVGENKSLLPEIAKTLADAYNGVNIPLVIGVENMHMTSKDTPDENRRFGYTPEECIEFMRLIAAKCKHKVGINLDIGHARNNAPYSQTYQVGTWYSMVGEYTVGYHIHQVNSKPGCLIENHIGFDDVYSRLISLSSFFRGWAEGQLNRAPLIFEMRPEGAYEMTLETFDKHKNLNVYDLHSHTHWSNCSDDDGDELVRTAIASGLSLFAITDHRHGIKDRIEEYKSEVRALAQRYKDRIKLLCGIEIATLPYKFDSNIASAVKGFDFCLIEHIDEADSTVGINLFEFAKSLGIRCGIAHTDLFHYCDVYGLDYLTFFKKLADAGIFWELNVSYDSTHHFKEYKYVSDLMSSPEKIKIVKDSGVYMSVGFDSHIHLEYNAERVYDACRFLKDNGINSAYDIFGGFEK